MNNRRRFWILLTSFFAAVVVYYLLPREIGTGTNTIVLNELARRTCAIFVVAVIFWATEVIPLFATSLCIIGLEILFLADKGGMATKLPLFFPTADDLPEGVSISYTKFLESFSSGIIILFMGGFLLSAAVTKHGLDKAIASRLLRPFSKSPVLLVFGVMGITGFFSMWMSNTATTVMMLAIIGPLVRQLPSDDKFHRAVILAVPFGANIGGIGTPIGTPPNAVAMSFLRQTGVNISFLDWMLMALPLALLLMFVAGWLLLIMFPKAKDTPMPELEHPKNKISFKGWMTMAILGTAIFLWVFSSVLDIGLSSAAVALLAAAALTALGVLEKHDVDRIDWNVLILMWGGLSLGLAMEETGFIDFLASAFNLLPDWASHGFVLTTLVVGLSVVMSTFMSNTATANVLVPTVMAIGSAAGGQSIGVHMTVLCALACSFAMAMPVSTPPNAIAFATGKIPASALIRSGGLVSIICMVVLLLGYQLVLALFLG